jgi:hypothetical protein
MRTYLAVTLSAVAVATLLASPAMARSPYYYRHYYRNYGPYTPALPVPRYGRYRDFQDGPRG